MSALQLTGHCPGYTPPQAQNFWDRLQSPVTPNGTIIMLLNDFMTYKYCLKAIRPQTYLKCPGKAPHLQNVSHKALMISVKWSYLKYTSNTCENCTLVIWATNCLASQQKSFSTSLWGQLLSSRIQVRHSSQDLKRTQSQRWTTTRANG